MASVSGVRRTYASLLVLAIAFVTMAAVTARPAQAAYPGANGWVVFERGFDIWVVPSAGGTATNLTNGAGGWFRADPAFSPDGTKIAFSQSGLGGIANVFVGTFNPSAPSLTGVQQVTNGNADGEPSWSPDGTQLVFERLETRPIATGTATAADPTGALLTDAAATFVTAGVASGMTVTNSTAAWSGTIAAPPGSETTVATAPATTGAWAIGDAYTITFSNTAVYKVTIGGSPASGSRLSAAAPLDYSDSNPVWSPLGTSIAFNSNRVTNSDVFTMNTSGGALNNLTTATQFDDNAYRPAWSPDGLRIAFQTNEPNTAHANIWAVDASDGGNAVNITGAYTGTDDDRDAAYSPDGTRIVFTRQASGATSRGLATINADGSGSVATVIAAAGTTLNNEPNWQPQLVGVADAYGVDEGATLNVAASGVLTNDKTFSIGTPTAEKLTDPAHGTLTLNTDGSLTYTHDGSETTSDSFTYRPNQNGVVGTATTVTITVTPTNDAPVAVNDGPYQVDEQGGDFTLAAPGVLANDSDVEGDGLTAVKVTDPANGSVSLNADGSFTYNHDGSDTDTDSFTYQAKDSSGALSNVATVSLLIGDRPIHSAGLVNPSQGTWTFYDVDGSVSIPAFYFGNPGDYPIMGDWDCDGVETPGMYRQSDGYVYLRNSNTAGPADIKFFFGNPGDVPIAGDFNGDGCGTVSIYRPSNQTFYIINELGENNGGLGAAEFSYVFGNPGDKPFVGDFDGDGIETVGLHRESTGLVYFRNSHTQGTADNQFIFGDPGDRLIAGDWNGDGAFSPALFRPSDVTMYFRYTNTQGNADNQYVPATNGSSWLPVSGLLGN